MKRFAILFTAAAIIGAASPALAEAVVVRDYSASYYDSYRYGPYGEPYAYAPRSRYVYEGSVVYPGYPVYGRYWRNCTQSYTPNRSDRTALA